eukprot:TRINITY_DN9170_c0_g1_i1.p1 TRINITY_DN9170_c0_g1~~TRINITY_DN9170_c0_g1_i1.p1  ORF type:complete len:223 (+),score=10.31 TRINITY_DN9170_c0_g1_i1:84-752(+)
MWLAVYFLTSIYLDTMFTICVLFGSELSHWLHFSKFILKVLVLVMVAWRLSDRSAGVWVTVSVVILSSLIEPLILSLSSALFFVNQDNAGTTSFMINRIVEAPTMVVYCSKLGQRLNQVGRNFDQVVPLASPDTSAFISKTCTRAELCLPSEHSGDSEGSMTCSICLERIELNDGVTQLTCEHCFHTDCASQWILRCETLDCGQILCPMRCALTRVVESSVA